MAEHGTVGCYTNQRCRCTACRTAHTVYDRQWRRRVRQAGQGASSGHGTCCNYIHYGCRCDACRAAKAAYERAYRARRRAALLQAGGGAP